MKLKAVIACRFLDSSGLSRVKWVAFRGIGLVAYCFAVLIYQAELEGMHSKVELGNET